MEEVFKWVCDIVNSCQHDFHFEAANNIITLFAQRYPDEKDKLLELEIMCVHKWNVIHNILT